MGDPEAEVERLVKEQLAAEEACENERKRLVGGAVGWLIWPE